MMSYLPILGKGECFMINNAIPMPIHLQIKKPNDDFNPKSTSPLESYFK